MKDYKLKDNHFEISSLIIVTIATFHHEMIE
jgi:hypothetical protein